MIISWMNGLQASALPRILGARATHHNNSHRLLWQPHKKSRIHPINKQTDNPTANSPDFFKATMENERGDLVDLYATLCLHSLSPTLQKIKANHLTPTGSSKPKTTPRCKSPSGASTKTGAMSARTRRMRCAALSEPWARAMMRSIAWRRRMAI